MIRGIDPEEEEKVIPLQKFIKRGELDLSGDKTVLGVELARKLQHRRGRRADGLFARQSQPDPRWN